MNLNLKQIRNDFPALNQDIKGKPPIYLDNACMTLRPRSVVEAMNEYYYKHPSCHKRAMHKFGQSTTMQFEKSRAAVRDFINAKQIEEIVFTKNATEAINLVANSFSWEEGDVVLTTDMEHNSNNLPWQILHKRKNVEYRTFPLSPDGIFDLNAFKQAVTPDVKLVSIFHTSHVTGYSLPVEEIIKRSHAQGALVLIDGAQAVPHQNIDVQKSDADFYAFSFHKMLGPSGMGCLFAKKAHLEKMSPFLLGGEAVDDVDYNSFVLSQIPDRFEAGLQNYAGAMGVTAAIAYLKGMGMDHIRKHITELNDFITVELSKSSRVNILGPQDAQLRAGIVNFTIDGIDSGELSLILDEASNIMTRGGVHCCHAWYKKYEKQPSLRISTYFYNTLEEVEISINALKNIVNYF